MNVFFYKFSAHKCRDAIVCCCFCGITAFWKQIQASPHPSFVIPPNRLSTLLLADTNRQTIECLSVHFSSTILKQQLKNKFCKKSSQDLLDFLNLQAWGKGLLDFFGLLFVLDDQSVQETGATNLEFGVAGVLLYFHGTSISPTSLVQEIFNFFDFTGHLERKISMHTLIIRSHFGGQQSNAQRNLHCEILICKKYEKTNQYWRFPRFERKRKGNAKLVAVTLQGIAIH